MRMCPVSQLKPIVCTCVLYWVMMTYHAVSLYLDLSLIVEACCGEPRPDSLNCLHFFFFSIWRWFYRSVPTHHPAEGSRCTEHLRTPCSFQQRSIVGMWVCVMDDVCVLPTDFVSAGCCVISGRFLAVLVPSNDDSNIWILSSWW